MSLIKIALILLLLPSLIGGIQTQKAETATQTYKLYCRRKHNEYEKAYFSLGHRKTDQHLLYGNLTLNGDSDWFNVLGNLPENKSRILDMGEKEWDNIYYVPHLPFRPICPDTGGSCTPTRLSKPDATNRILADVNGHHVKIMVGHIYVLHIQCDQEGDFYAMLRIDELKNNDECTITWKRVPSPEE